MAAPAMWKIPQEIRVRLSDQSGRQRCMVAGDELVMVLHRVPEPRKTARKGVYFWRKLGGDWEYSERGQAMPALRQHVKSYTDAILRLEEAHDRAKTSADWHRVLEEVGPLYRAARNMYETLQEARASIPELNDRAALQGPCDLASDVVRAAELLQMDANNALQFAAARHSEVQAELSQIHADAAHRLNMMAAIFFPLATIATIFGMNLHHGLEELPFWVFWVVLAAGIALGLSFTSLVTAKREKRRSSDS